MVYICPVCRHIFEESIQFTEHYKLHSDELDKLDSKDSSSEVPIKKFKSGNVDRPIYIIYDNAVTGISEAEAEKVTQSAPRKKDNSKILENKINP